MKRSRARLARAIMMACAGLYGGSIARGQLVNRDWNTGTGNWNIAGNWTPNTSAPDNGTPPGVTYTVQIGNLLAAAGAQVTLVPVSGTSDTINTLTISNSADLFTNGNQLNVLGATTLDGAGSTIRVDPHATPGTPAFQSFSLALNNGGGLTMAGGVVSVSGGQLEINAGSAIGGHGIINLGDFDGVVEQVFDNSGLLQPQGNTAAPQTLTIHANGVDTIDLDGDSETGVVDVDSALANVNADTLTLVIDGPLADPFGGIAGAAIQVGQRDTITFTKDFQIAGPAAISMNGGTQTATMNGAGQITSITGASFTISGAAVIANNATFAGTANVVTVNANSSLELAGTVAIPDASMISLTNTSQLVISGSTTITEPAGDFNWDGPGAATTTIKGTGQLSLNVNRVNTASDVFTGTLNLDDDGDVSVNNVANAWTMAGTLHKRNAGNSIVAGDAVNVTGSVVVDAGGALTLPTGTLSTGANVTANGTVILGGASVFAGPASISGTGFLRMAGTSTVSASTTIGVATFDWDGVGTGTQHTINAGAIFTINSPTLDTDGDMDDPFSLAGPGAQVIVNGPSQWTSNATITANVAAAVGSVVIGGTSRLNMAGTLNVDGPATISAPITFASGSTTAIDAGVTLSLTGGNSIGNSNLISGGVISGPGTLAVSAGRVLSGFGTISSPVAFSGDAVLEAAGGLLTLSGTIVNGGLMRVGAGTSALNLTNAFNTSSTLIGIQLNGGTLQGATLTISKSIRGNGTITNAIVNGGTLQAESGTLVVNNASNDWDGPANTGILRAQSSGVLDLRDNATFPFGGSVVATSSGRVFTNGFGMTFNPGSTISLTSGTFESTSSTNIGGTLTTGIGAASTIKVTNNFFITFEPTSNTTLGADLRLENNNVNIEAGATFSGSGALVIPSGSHLVMDNSANASVLLDMQGAFRPGNFEGIGRVDLKDYQQRSAPADPNAHLTDKGGQLFVEVRGTALNQYDRLVVNGTAQVDGYLNIDIDEVSPGVPFMPAIGDTFNIITATSLVGKFDDVDISGMPAGETFYVNYLGNAVQLIVVARPSFAADFDDDGDVDYTDLAIWKGAYRLNQLGDATGDNVTDNRDWTIWRDQLGSKPAAPGFASAVPEPGVGGLLAILSGLGMLRRRVRRAIAPLCVTLMMLLPAISHAKPTMTVASPGAGMFVVQVAPDAALFNGASGSLALELAFDIIGTDVGSATINTGSFPYSLPGSNPFTGNTTEGVQLNLATDKVFISLGSNSFTTGAMVNVATISTGAGPTAVSWGGHFITSFTPNFTGSRIAQNGVFYDGFQGVVNSPGALVGDFEPDGDLDASDIDALLHATQGSIPPGQAKFDLNRNSLVNSFPNSANSDADIWIRLLKHTEYGDANLDRKVDIKDLYLLASHWKSAGGWASGDFNGSGFVDAADLGMLASKWQFGVSSGGGAGFAQALESVGLPAMTTVPEPSLAGVIGVTLLLSFRRGNARRGAR